MTNSVYSIEQLKSKIIPVLQTYGINDAYLFGSYARGEADGNSDVDIYCDKGAVRTFVDLQRLKDELETSLDKKVDIVFTTTVGNESFLEEIKRDLIKLQ